MHPRQQLAQDKTTERSGAAGMGWGGRTSAGGFAFSSASFFAVRSLAFGSSTGAPARRLRRAVPVESTFGILISTRLR